MDKLELTVEGRVPSKKNSKRVFARGGRVIVIPSENHQLWHEEQSYRIKKFRPKKPIEKCEIRMMFYAPDKRKTDLDNKSTTILDLLVDNQIISDDSWFVVNKLTLEFVKIDRENPRAEIIIFDNH